MVPPFLPPYAWQAPEPSQAVRTLEALYTATVLCVGPPDHVYVLVGLAQRRHVMLLCMQ